MHAIWSYPILSSAVAAEGGDRGLPGGGSPGALFTHRGLLCCGRKSYLLRHSIIMSRRGYDGRSAFYRLYSRWGESTISVRNLYIQLPYLLRIDFVGQSFSLQYSLSALNWNEQHSISSDHSRAQHLNLELPRTPQVCWVGGTLSLSWVYTPFSQLLLCTLRFESLKGEVRRRT